MQAIICTAYGPPEVLQLREVPTPAPKEGELLVRVHAHTINYGDLVARTFATISPGEFNMPLPLWLLARLSFGWRRPRVHILGSEFAGEVAAVGAGVTRYRPGDRVFGYLGQQMGANAEYLCVAEAGMVATMPEGLSYAEAAALPYGALTALGLLRNVTLGPGRRVLVVGASGGIGAAAVQLARHAGAEVTGVCGTNRVAYVRALGAARVLDYTREPIAAAGGPFDVVLDVLGRSSFAEVRPLLTPEGRYLRASFKLRELSQMAWTAMRGGRRVICAFAAETPADMQTVRGLAEAGALRAVVDRCFPLEETAAAHRYVESGERRGPVVVLPVAAEDARAAGLASPVGAHEGHVAGVPA